MGRRGRWGLVAGVRPVGRDGRDLALALSSQEDAVRRRGPCHVRKRALIRSEPRWQPPASRTVRSQCVSSRPPSLWCCQAAQRDQHNGRGRTGGSSVCLGVRDPSARLPAVTSDSARPRWSCVSFSLNQPRLPRCTCLSLHQRTTRSSVTFINVLLNSVDFTSEMPFPSFLVSQFPCYFRLCLSLSLSVSRSSSVILQKEERL